MSANVVNSIKTVYQYIQFCVKCGHNQISSCAPQIRGFRQYCGLRPYLFNIFRNYTVGYVDAERERETR